MAPLVNIGSAPNDGTGDPLRTAFSKINTLAAGLPPEPLNLTAAPFGTGQQVAAGLNDGLHNDFGNAVQLASGKIFQVFKRSTSHTAPGTVGYRTSTDEGNSWSAVGTLGPDIDVISQVVAGVGFANRLFVFYTRNATLGVHLITSTDEGLTWTSPVQIVATVAARWYIPYGPVLRIGGGKLAVSYYGQPNGGADLKEVFFLTSSDNGTTWATTATIYSATLATPTTPGHYSEMAIAYLGAAELIGLVRDDTSTGQQLTQFHSTDNGLTWVNQGAVTFDATTLSHMAPWIAMAVATDGGRFAVLVFTNMQTGLTKAIVGRAERVGAGPANWEPSTLQTLGGGQSIHYISLLLPISGTQGLLIGAQEPDVAHTILGTYEFDAHLDIGVPYGRGLTFRNGSFLVRALDVGLNAANNDVYVGPDTNNQVLFRTANAVRASIDSAGSFSITPPSGLNANALFIAQPSGGSSATAFSINQPASGTFSAAIIVGGGTVTGALSPTGINFSQTWNTSGSPVAFYANITNTGSGANARLLELDVAATNQFSVDVNGNVRVKTNQVLSTRRTGWTAWTGTAARGTQNADAPPTLTQVAQALKALIDDLIAHGLIGT